MKRILIVDDEPNVHYSFQKILGLDYEILEARDGKEAVQKVQKESPDLVLLDVRIPGMDGLKVLDRIKELDSRIPVIVMTAFGTMQTAVEAMKLGAFEYILKPFDVPVILDLVKKSLAVGEAAKKKVSYPSSAVTGEEQIIGASAGMQEVYKLIGQVAEKDITVLVRGESGTGKELVARAIYQNSRRAKKAFIPVNCAAIPDTLLESELFGFEKGAFTGASEKWIGRFEQANGGTIFLDEVGSMSPSTQAKILRVLQEGEFNRLGGKEVVRVDVRILAATNMDLQKAVSTGKFREDLYYRLNVITVLLPPLRERKEDVPPLVNYFIQKYRGELGKEIQAVNPAALQKLQGYSWPGNVRELENIIKRAMVLARGNMILPDDIQISISEGLHLLPGGEQVPAGEGGFWEKTFREGQGKVLKDLEKMAIERALQFSGGNQKKAAENLGISRTTLRAKMKEYGIETGRDEK
ncbi:MAG: sigma-54 dependent transcriptional regulator [Proteobacteria bacterium]|nr:sigma-54 dependent transcriptional regulator [Pseudomonadota bacterium]